MVERSATRSPSASAKDIDDFIAKRAQLRIRDGEATSQEVIEEFWRASEAKHRRQRHEENRWRWIRFYDLMARNHARIAEESRRKADALIEGRS